MDAKRSPAKPLVIKKNNIAFIANSQQIEGKSTGNVFKNLVREDVLYDTTDMYFLKGEFQRLLLVNRFNILTKHSRTVAKYFYENGSVLEKTSDKVTEVIGQEQFNTLFTALCSILDQQLKIRSILTLLTSKTTIKLEKHIPKPENGDKAHVMKILVDNSCQTDEMRIEPMKPKKKRIRKPCSPYIVQDNTEAREVKLVKKVVDVPKTSISQSNDSGPESLIPEPSEAGDSEKSVGNSHLNMKKPVLAKFNSIANLMDLGADLGLRNNDNSNDSETRLSALSDTPTHPELLTNPLAICDTVDQHTKETYKFVVNVGEFLIPGTDIKVAYKPEDIFHIATRENLDMLEEVQRKKLLQHQFTIDFQHCLTPMDEDGNLPIHLAVLNNDLVLLSRQCLVLKMRGSNVDIPVCSNGLTAMQLAIQLEAAPLVSCLARHGAATLRTDAAYRSPLHDAAERHSDVLRALVTVTRARARAILSEDEELWREEMAQKTDAELGEIIMQHASNMFDKQGYTPLMLASKLGLYENVRLLLEHCPASVNTKMPTSGNTALYLATAAACNSCIERGNKAQVVDHFQKTIEVLMQYGADPSIENHSSTPTNVHSLLQEFNHSALSMMIAQINNCKKVNGKGTTETDSSKLMLIKDKEGNVECKSIERERKKRTPKKATNKKETRTNMAEKIIIEKDKALESQGNKQGKLVILKNAIVKPGNTSNVCDPEPGNINVATANNIKIVKLRKVDPKTLKIANPMMITNVVTQKVGQAVKRKQTEGPNVIKQARASE